MKLCRMPWGILVALLALAPACDRSPKPGESSGNKTNVLLLTVDTLRADRLGCYGYERPTSPTMDGIAKSGVRFDQAYAPRGATWPSLTTLHTGQYPLTHGVRNNGEVLRPDHRTLASLLKEEGYATAAFLSNYRQARHNGFDTVWGIEDEIAGLKHVQPQYVWDEAITERGLEWLEAHGGEPFFLWLHYMDPHEDYLPPRPFDKAFVEGKYEGDVTGKAQSLMNITLGQEVTEEDLDHIQSLYDGQILSTDGMIARVLQALEKFGVRENTLIVLTSDHGEELFDHNRYFFHAASIYDSSLRVPLVFEHPNLLPQGVTVSTPVELSDVTPTLIRLLGIELPGGAAARLDGEDLVPLMTGESSRRKRSATFHEWASTDPGRLGMREVVYAVRSEGFKLIDNPYEVDPDNPPYRDTGRGFEIERRELYDLSRDPGEQHDLLAGPDGGRWDSKVDELTEILRHWVAEQSRKGTKSGKMTPEGRQELINLGYIDPDEEEDPGDETEGEGAKGGE